MNTRMLAGEPVDLLDKALASFTWTKRKNGRIRLTSELDQELGPPFLRALMRVEAELLIQDADRFGKPDFEMRTPEERRADALVALALRVADARAI